MMLFQPEAPYEHGQAPSIGVLVANLGTPDAPTAAAVRTYLHQFLRDQRVTELPRWKWYPILYGLVLPFRPRRVCKLYASIWTDEGSPLLVIAKRQVEGLRTRFRDAPGQQVHFALGMRYGNPSIQSAAAELRAKGCTHLLLLPLYPQYCAATTGSTMDALAGEMLTWRHVPEVRTINCYHDDPGYIGSLAASIRELWDRDGEPERILFTYHGIPKRFFENGDPYHCHCHKTTRLVSQKLGIEDQRAITAFQSQFGREEWIKPVTEATVRRLAQDGCQSLDIVCPGFSADCLETIDEIDVLNREIFEKEGGGRFRFIPCLNDRDDHLDALTALITRHLQGWQLDSQELEALERDLDVGASRAAAMLSA